MNNKFILNETTGIGIIEDVNSNNTLFRTEGNAENVRLVLEKENEIESEKNKIKDIKKQIEENYIYLFAKYISYISGIAAILALIPTYSIIVNQGYTLSNTLIVGSLFGTLGAFNVISKRMIKPYKKLINDNELLYDKLELSEEKLEELLDELTFLKFNTKIENIEITDLDSSKDSPSIIYPDDNIQNIDILINTGKVKSLKQDF